MKFVKKFVVALCLAMLAITAYAVTPPGVAVTSKASGMVAGGSDVSLTWAVPVATTHKVWLQVPANSNATNALYRVYPNGSLQGSTDCSPVDATHPCFEISVNQALTQNTWVQLTSNEKTQWKFTKNGYVSVNPSNLASNESLGVAVVRFEKVLTLSLEIGKAYQGGIIFYLDATKEHGLIAAPTDQGTGVPWNKGTSVVTGATRTGFATGLSNTTAIVAAQGAGTYAAKLCADLELGGYSDWYLPSKDELNLMYTNIGPKAAAPRTNVGQFASNVYWSSSETGGNQAWNQYFDDGYQNYSFKYYPLYVRAIRSF